MEAYSTVRTGTRRERAAAAAGLALALVLLRLPFRHTVRAVRHTARLWPGRAACMETSLGAVLAAALLGRRLTWCLGARFAPPPVEYHAWAELPGHGPVGEYTADGWHRHTALTV
ncbi:lasso peptide biosynthesis B2 protein [Streptomyces sp. 110]|uniref:Lasso peptide biosynthesis B2 protein n=1 Tax=Streptomyces endocoffeicus TaxID=2898945 RepID=A0ABS1Q815_9ACTN|nr:lasso peptide biosynthesis B2 protein [Streptomyces endocoffeicus]MBL1120277.1 lasso peptide biosynthesis B2 protein [Streptomyces endocoffeicus]